MPVSSRHQQPLRLPRDVAERARRQAERKKISVNAYVQFALEAKLDADEARQKERAEDRQKERKGDEAPRGLGLRLLRRPETAPLPAAPAAIEGPAPVVVNVGTKEGAAGEGGDLIAVLAAYVMGGPAFERERRQRTAVDILGNHGKTTSERGGLVRQLDQALAALKAQRPARTSLGDIGSLFR